MSAGSTSPIGWTTEQQQWWQSIYQDVEDAYAEGRDQITLISPLDSDLADIVLQRLPHVQSWKTKVMRITDPECKVTLLVKNLQLIKKAEEKKS